MGEAMGSLFHLFTCVLFYFSRIRLSLWAFHVMVGGGGEVCGGRTIAALPPRPDFSSLYWRGEWGGGEGSGFSVNLPGARSMLGSWSTTIRA